MAGIVENQGSRMFHLMMIIPAGGLLLLLSLISLGTMANTNGRVADQLDEVPTREDEDCILFAEEEEIGGVRFVRFSEGSQCEFAIAGTALLAILSVGFAILLIVKGVVGISV